MFFCMNISICIRFLKSTDVIRSHEQNFDCPETHETTQKKKYNCDVRYKIKRAEYDFTFKGYKWLQDDKR